MKGGDVSGNRSRAGLRVPEGRRPSLGRLDRLPLPIEKCPTCGHAIKFTRSPMKVNSRKETRKIKKMIKKIVIVTVSTILGVVGGIALAVLINLVKKRRGKR